jgi:hypothetical protein
VMAECPICTRTTVEKAVCGICIDQLSDVHSSLHQELSDRLEQAQRDREIAEACLEWYDQHRADAGGNSGSPHRN